jgi:hypothetical protein
MSQAAGRNNNEVHPLIVGRSTQCPGPLFRRPGHCGASTTSIQSARQAVSNHKDALRQVNLRAQCPGRLKKRPGHFVELLPGKRVCLAAAGREHPLDRFFETWYQPALKCH